MRKLSNHELEKFELLTKHSISFTVLEPTETGIDKSIMDATGPVRTYLLNENIHDYSTQKQGPKNKIIIKAHLLDDSESISSNESLYRPLTKKGDPRIWFYELKKFVTPNDILGIIAFKGELVVLNLTKVNIESLLKSDKKNILQDIVSSISESSDAPVIELLTKLKELRKMGPIPASVDADTAVGRTLETALGININSSRQPDYKGIELKSFREKRGTRKTLFAQVPNWKLSKFKKSAEILDAFGYQRGEDFKLYCTVSSTVINSQGLSLEVDSDNSNLLENSSDKNIGNFVIWPLEELHSRLLEKHNETFWVTTESVMIEGKEHFIYKSIEHTKNPLISQFDILLETGAITVDHLIKRKPNGGAQEKGPFFKIKPNCLNLLFPPSKTYKIT